MRAETFLILIVLALIALVSFLGIISEINKTFGVEIPAFGGALREGVLGNPRFMNPLLAQTDADRDLVSLVFAGLFHYNKDGNLSPLLADKYETSANGLTYTITLKDKLYWSNGDKLTADDIIFTIELAKNPLAQSPRRANWEGVEVEKVDEKIIRFHLKKAYVPFIENLTIGILPKKLWEHIPASQISFAELNTNPIGSGPYKIKSVKRDSFGSISSIEITANKSFALGRPNIKTIIFSFYADEDSALRDLSTGFLDSLGGVSAKKAGEFKDKSKINTISLKRIIAVFLNQGSQKSFSSANTRRALNLALNKNELVEKVLGGYGEVIDGPLPKSTNEVAYEPDLAKDLLTRQKKDSAAFAFTLTTVKTPELVELAEILKNMWENVGFKVTINTFPVNDLESDVIGPRQYDAFLYGEEVIGKNPDPFAFWHSSQRAHPGFNIALYANSKVDKLLEEVRITQDADKRDKLYDDIHKEIKKDLPAIFLFSPHYIYITPQDLRGADFQTINTGSDRFAEVYKWYLKRNYAWKIFF